MIRIAVLYGGRSGEHDVSRCSAASVIKSLNPDRYEIIPIGIDHKGKWNVQEKHEIIQDPSFGSMLTIQNTGTWLVHHHNNDGKLLCTEINSGKTITADVVFPVMHGTYGEDGTLQGLLELADVPFVGSSLLGSAVGMDKDMTKCLLRDAGIPVVPWKCFYRHQWEGANEGLIEDILTDFDFPLFVKPARAGSSVGVSRARTHNELSRAINEAFLFDNKILVEQSVNAREIECSVLGLYDIQTSVLGEVIPRHDFYSYEAKYIDAEGAAFKVPAEINENLTMMIRDSAARAFRILNCEGLARVDFFLEKEGNCFYFNEINTLPGFTSISMYPKLWQHSGLNYSELLDRLVDIAFKAYESRNRLVTEYHHMEAD